MGRVGDIIRVVQHPRASNNRAVTKPHPKDPGESVSTESCKEKPLLPRGLYRAGPWGIKTLTSLSPFSLWPRAMAPSVHTSQEAGELRGRLVGRLRRLTSWPRERTDGEGSGVTLEDSGRKLPHVLFQNAVPVKRTVP